MDLMDGSVRDSIWGSISGVWWSSLNAVHSMLETWQLEKEYILVNCISVNGNNSKQYKGHWNNKKEVLIKDLRVKEANGYEPWLFGYEEPEWAVVI
jgi:hypothetical protein